MSIIIAERHGNYGIVLADSYISRTFGSSHLTTDPDSHALKLHALSDNFCIGFAGAYQLGADIVTLLASRFRGQFDNNENWGEIVNSVYLEILNNTGHSVDSVDFIVGWFSSVGLQFAIIRNGAIVSHRDPTGIPAYIGDSKVFAKYREVRASIPTQAGTMPGGDVIPPGICEREKSKKALSMVLHSRQYDTVGTLSPFGCSLTHEPGEGFMFPIAAEAAQGDNCSGYSHATLVTVKGTRALAYYYKNISKGFLFISGQAKAIAISAPTSADFKRTVEAQFGITLLGSEWELT